MPFKDSILETLTLSAIVKLHVRLVSTVSVAVQLNLMEVELVRFPFTGSCNVIEGSIESICNV